MYDAINSRYTYKNSNVLKNKLNIKTEKKLKEYETKMVAFKLTTIQKLSFERTYDEKHLRFIHQYLFFEIYDFAGKYRLENITKENFLFSDFHYIEENIKDIMKKIDINVFKKYDFDTLVSKISEIMTDLNVLHPFREGNGRTTREFIRQLLEDLGYEIKWYLIDYDEILEASRKAVSDDSEQIELLKRSINKKS